MRQRVFAVVCCVAWWMSYELKGDAEQFASRTSGPVIKGAALMAKLLNLIEFPLRNRCCFSPAPTYRDWPQEYWTLQCCFCPWHCVYFAADPLVTCKLWNCGVPVVSEITLDCSPSMPVTIRSIRFQGLGID